MLPRPMAQPADKRMKPRREPRNSRDVFVSSDINLFCLLCKRIVACGHVVPEKSHYINLMVGWCVVK